MFRKADNVEVIHKELTVSFDEGAKNTFFVDHFGQKMEYRSGTTREN